MIRRHAELLARLHPRGAVEVETGTTSRAELDAWGDVLDHLDDQIDQLLQEANPSLTGELLSRWEALLGIYRVSGRSAAHRRRIVVQRLRRLPNCTPATLAQLLGQVADLTVTIVEPGSFRCDEATSLTDTPDDVLDGALVFFVTLDWAAARVSGLSRDELQEEVDTLKPAHVVGLIRADDFRADDPWSLTNRDLLAA